MKKQNLKTLKLKKVSISKFEITGGFAPRGESYFNTVCDACHTDDCPGER